MPHLVPGLIRYLFFNPTPNHPKAAAMNSEKQQYLDRIRANTAYPTYRGIIGIIAMLGYALAALQGLAALITGFGTMGQSFVAGAGVLIAGLIMAALIFLGAKLWKEGALILVDMGDSITDANATNVLRGAEILQELE